MEIVLLIILILLTGIASVILYLNLKSKPKDDNENKEAEEIASLPACKPDVVPQFKARRKLEFSDRIKIQIGIGEFKVKSWI